MIKMVAAIRRKPGMTHAECLQYIEHVHGKLARDKPLTIRRYIQNHVFDSAFGADADSVYQQTFHRDSVTELYFDDFPSLIQTFTDPYVQQTVGPDGANFADLSEQTAQLMAEVELPVPNPGLGPVKVLHFMKKADGVTLEEFFPRWTDAHMAQLQDDPAFAAQLRKYAQGRYIPEGDRITSYFGPKIRLYEGVASLWFENEAALGGFRTYQRAMEKRSAQTPFLNASESFFVVAREVHIFDFT